MALVGLLHVLSRSASLVLTVAHVDHGLRTTSADDAALVTSLANTLGLPVRHRRLQLDRGPGLPARARTLRQAALIAIADEVGAGVVALGHTRTDQAETILLHLTRGAGLRGLAGMRARSTWSSAADVDTTKARARAHGQWWRPLLGLSRTQTRALAKCFGFGFIDDPTNDSREAPRTLIRHEVLPRLSVINAAAERALATAADHAYRAEQALAQWAGTELKRRRCSPPDGVAAVCAYDISDVAALPAEVRWRLIRGACQHAGLIADAVSAKVVEDLDVAWLHPGPARSWDLHPRSRAYLARDRFWVICGADGPNH